ncbi:hypothetical protein DIJ64_12545 [Mycobacterium leprae]|uniref:Uncharacterized protein n=1 Tax=Mycobacterium leprae TaxID=1769 RepID=A0AAD0KXV5_MYCLR|nr:hypothetical protein DIJ64_12545 [Mycobacterium leprae]
MPDTLAGCYGGWVDIVISHITDVFCGSLLLLVATVLIQVIHHRTIWTVIAILALLGLPQVARIARGVVFEMRASGLCSCSSSIGDKSMSNPAAGCPGQRLF